MNEFTIPEKPWTDADVAFLIQNEAELNDEIRAELGLNQVKEGEDRVEVTGVPGYEPAKPELVDNTPIEQEVPDVIIDATPTPTETPVVTTEPEAPTVNNTADNS